MSKLVYGVGVNDLPQLVAATESDPRVVEALKKRYSVEENE